MDPVHQSVLVAADVHLGSRYCREQALLRELKKSTAELIIIAGDTVHYPSYWAGNPSWGWDWDFFRWMRENRERLLVLIGNHDRDHNIHPKSEDECIASTTSMRSRLDEFGVRVARDYTFSCGPYRYYVTHGCKYDKRVGHKFWTCRAIAEIMSLSYDFVRRFDFADQRVFTCARRMFEKHTSVFNEITAKALSDARERQVHYIVKGHTHRRGIVRDPISGVTRINPGSWEQARSGLVSITPAGPRLEKYNFSYEQL